MFDGEAFGQKMVEIVRGYVDAEITPLREENAALRARLDVLDARELPLPEKGDPGEPGLPGEPGPSGEVDMDAVGQMIDDAVERAVAALPAPEKGERGDDGLPGEKGADGDPGAPGEPGKDGIGLANALKDAEGNLVLVMTDGSTKNFGRVDGKNGETFTLDDFDVVPLDERTIKLGFTHGDICHSFELEFPVVIYRGVFKEDGEYRRGDMATWAGSVWHCDEPKGLKPGAPDSGWTLAVKAGRSSK